MDKDKESEEFKKFREQMHGEEFEDDNDSKTPQNHIVRICFTIFMVVIYVGMGVLLFINFFDWDDQYAWMRYFVGVLLVIYGGWRAYRQYAGIDSRL